MKKRVLKLSEEQYSRLMEDNTVFSTSNNNKPETVIQTTKSGLSNAVSQALDTNATAIDITDGGTNESIITKKQLVSEARKEWK
ncbi:MAG: hypothetical protein J6X18_06940, partial [Bacteroidales bacterium]|nr:hypothetical protein [Bacteroidales bacterium]